jgi:hypothetical protein
LKVAARWRRICAHNRQLFVSKFRKKTDNCQYLNLELIIFRFDVLITKYSTPQRDQSQQGARTSDKLPLRQVRQQGVLGVQRWQLLLSMHTTAPSAIKLLAGAGATQSANCHSYLVC